MAWTFATSERIAVTIVALVCGSTAVSYATRSSPSVAKKTSGKVSDGGAPPAKGGAVDVNFRVVRGDNCPLLTSWSASPLQVSAPGGSIDLSATATDADARETLTFSWTAPAGRFTVPSSTGASGASATTKYVCDKPGPQKLTVTVTDNHVPSSCSASQTFPVTCVAVKKD
jgi:hypothetical protein